MREQGQERASVNLGGVVVSLIAIATTLFPVALWRVLYPASDWAALCLAPLALLLFEGFRRPLAAALRARAEAVVRHDSSIASFATGQLRAAVHATLFAGSAVVVLAWQALEADWAEALILAAAGGAGCCVAVYVPRWARIHFRIAVADHYGIALGALGVAVVLVPLLAWVNWPAVVHMGEEFRAVGLETAVKCWPEAQLPARRGWIAEGLAGMYAFEAGRIFAFAGLGPVGAVLYSAYLGLVAYLVARSSAAVLWFVQERLMRRCGRSAKAATRAFWGTVGVLAVATIGTAIVGSSDSPTGEPTTHVEEIFCDTPEANWRTKPDMEGILEPVYAPVYDAIPEFAEHHFSFWGRVQGLLSLFFGELEERIHGRLFEGFEGRLEAAAGDEVRELLKKTAHLRTLEKAIRLELDVITDPARTSIAGGIDALDQAIDQDEFEAKLRTLIDDHRVKVKRDLAEFLAMKSSSPCPEKCGGEFLFRDR